MSTPQQSSPLDAPRAWTFALTGAVAGGLTAGWGLALALGGMGLGNTTAGGTGMAAGIVGLWMALAWRGLFRRRHQTLVGLALGWTWLLGRILWDIPATLMTGVVWVFLLPSVAVPALALWGGLTLAFLGLLGVATFRTLRRAQARPPGNEAVNTLAALTSPPLPIRRSQRGWSWGLAFRLALLSLATLATPPLLNHVRGRELAKLAATYATALATAEVRPSWGACTSLFLGYSLTGHGAAAARSPQAREAHYERTLADAVAELDSIVRTGARYVRVGASGDQLLEAHPDQERLDDRFMAAVRERGVPLVLVDTQHPQVLRHRRLDWPAFCDFQRRRVEYYQLRYQPAVYLVVCEPQSYHQFVLTPQTRFDPEAWAAQLTAICRLIKRLQPDTRTGLCLLVGDDRAAEWEVWTRLRTLPELDLLSVEIYSPENFPQTEARLARYGHPRETGKAFWIAETYHGWALCAQRATELDVAWLRLADAFARHIGAEAVLVWSFGTFVPGGSLWDWGTGRLAARWRQTPELSPIGLALAERVH